MRQSKTRRALIEAIMKEVRRLDMDQLIELGKKLEVVSVQQE